MKNKAKSTREKMSCELNMYKQKINNDTLVSSAKTRLTSLIDNANGKVGVPILLYFLGVPGIVVLLLWALFFRGK